MTPFILPFAGICHRPYSQDFLSNVERRNIAPTIVPFRQLWLTQSTLNIEGIFGKRYSTDEFPHVVNYMGTYYLEDGTHRLVLLALKGHTVSRMRIIDWAEHHG